ncbi:MaoC/PaaZ C-terminal domain-containing protein [Alteromonas macleodii]|uniref:MaoC-like domain-containing protein n=1 Tax=Alteromonas macleodii TaxID=28108 RepID=A0A6T9Y759_ALTMA|nr:MaoC/PaaZ C-terminal domain-containing protein [Alteromonas macleodii]CAB9495206.1 conserved protein of unknown function [Alteromonas macleodii]
MEMHFSNHDIEKWAVFSGDRNPIHFDLDAALKIGVDGIVTHGMLVLLPIKKKMWSLIGDENGGWIEFKGLLKRPVVIDSAVELNIKERTDKFTFKVEEKGVKTPCILGKVCLSIEPEWKSGCDMVPLEKGFVKEKLSQFKSDLSDYYENWVWLDGLVFGHFIQNQIGRVISQTSLASLAGDGNIKLEEIENVTVVQTSHRVSFSSEVNDYDFLDLDSSGDISYQVDGFEIIENKGEILGVVGVGVFVKGKNLMLMELGLMVKHDF